MFPNLPGFPFCLGKLKTYQKTISYGTLRLRLILIIELNLDRRLLMEACNGNQSCDFPRRLKVGTRILTLATKVVRLYGCFTPDDRIGVAFLFSAVVRQFPRSTLATRLETRHSFISLISIIVRSLIRPPHSLFLVGFDDDARITYERSATKY